MAFNREDFVTEVITDLSQLQLNSPAVTLDLNEDAWEFGAPPPFDAYDVKWVLDKDGMKLANPNKNNPNNPDKYITLSLVGKVVSTDKDIDGIPVFTSLNTRIFRGKNISTAVGFLVKAGASKYIPNPATPAQIADLVCKVLKKEPIVKAELDWRGSYQYTDPKTGVQSWKNEFNSWKDFPNNADEPGTKQHIVRINNAIGGGSAEVRAMLQVNRFFAKGEALPDYKKLRQEMIGVVSAPRGVQPVKVNEPTLVLDGPPSPPLVSGLGNQVQVGNDDSELLLAE